MEHPPPEMGYPLPGVPPLTQSSIASTCYAVGGVPLAFTQEDFVVTLAIGVFGSVRDGRPLGLNFFIVM